MPSMINDHIPPAPFFDILGPAAARTPTTPPFLGGSAVVEAARALRAEFACDAPGAARLRAELARRADNGWHFCHWREVERLLTLDASAPLGALN
ncbi:MAG: hypothetical protein IT553_11120 [Sphingomonadaceae bacterium]|nr:hypothetical protein [Sphingomonadaceae bacterium]